MKIGTYISHAYLNGRRGMRDVTVRGHLLIQMAFEECWKGTGRKNAKNSVFSLIFSVSMLK